MFKLLIFTIILMALGISFTMLAAILKLVTLLLGSTFSVIIAIGVWLVMLLIFLFIYW